MNDQQVGSLLGMRAQIVRHYGKRARIHIVADDLTERIAGAMVTLLPGLRKKKASE